MISKGKYELVKKAIKIHNNLKDRIYLILYKSNAKQMSKIMETPILEQNFWHLVGCRIDETLTLTPQQKHQMYIDCVDEKDISQSLVYTRQAQDVSKKSNVLFYFILDFQFHLTCTSSAAFSCSIAFTTVARGQARLKRSNCAVSGPNTLPESSHSFASSTIRCSSSSSVKP